MPSPTRLLVNLVAAGAIITAPAAKSAEISSFTEDLPAYHVVSDGVFRGGQPSLAGLSKLKQQGVKTIVCFRTNRQVIEDESKESERLGMNFVSIPLTGISRPSESQVEKFLAVVQDTSMQPVFVHCQWGQDRTGTMVGIYRQAVDHWSAQRAYDEMLALGFHPRYAWLGDAVFDYEGRDSKRPSPGRPLGVKIFDSFNKVVSLLD
jgi:protein tyrosine/serine phosphatase